MRYRFLPYLYDLFYQGEQTGLPVMRPLVLHYPKDPETYNLNGEFLVGENLLVAPVLEQGSHEENGVSAGRGSGMITGLERKLPEESISCRMHRLICARCT